MNSYLILLAAFLGVFCESTLSAQQTNEIQREKIFPVSRKATHVPNILGTSLNPVDPTSPQKTKPNGLVSIRPVRPDTTGLEPLGAGEVSSFAIDVGSRELICEVTHYMHTYLGSLAFWGSIKDVRHGRFAAALNNGQLTLRVNLPAQETFLLYPVNDKAYALRHSKDTEPLLCGTRPTEPPTEPRPASSSDTTEENLQLPGTNVIDGVLLYTFRHTEWAADTFGTITTPGNNGLMITANFCLLHEAAINQSLTDSLHTNAQYTLLGHTLVNIDDGSHFDKFVDNTTNPPTVSGGGGISDFMGWIIAGPPGAANVRECRKAVGADVIGVLTGIRDESANGIAPVIAQPWILGEGDLAFHAFSASAQVIEGLTIQHEIGHNLGCAHDRHSTTFDGMTGAHNWSHGHAWIDDPSVAHANMVFGGTIMSYAHSFLEGPNPEHDNHADDGDPYTDDSHSHGNGAGQHAHAGDRVHVFSNPDVIIDGQATGVSQDDFFSAADNAKSIADTSAHVKNFRARIPLKDEVWVDLSHWGDLVEYGTESHPFDTVEEGILLVHPEGTLVFKPGVETGQFGFSKRIKKIRVEEESGPDDTGNLGG